MAIDVLNYPELQHAERALLAYENDHLLGRFHGGQEESIRLGDGLEIDGLREYQAGDDARHIDWRASARLGNGELLTRLHYAEQAPLTVVVSDVPRRERFAQTVGDPLTARALGFVVCQTLLKSAVQVNSPIFAVWSDGFQDITPRPADMPKEGPQASRIFMLEGLRRTKRSEDINLQLREPKKRGFFKKVETVAMPDEEGFADVFDRTVRRTKRFADAARFVIVSDFRSDDFDTLVEQMKHVSKTSDVLSVQITNPLLRELPSDVAVFRAGAGQGNIIESDSQRMLYKQMAAKKQVHIDQALKAVSTKTITIDTMLPHRAVA